MRECAQSACNKILFTVQFIFRRKKGCCSIYDWVEFSNLTDCIIVCLSSRVKMVVIERIRRASGIKTERNGTEREEAKTEIGECSAFKAIDGEPNRFFTSFISIRQR